jgi:APA family basic amino acid/polyamine antiporter
MMKTKILLSTVFTQVQTPYYCQMNNKNKLGLKDAVMMGTGSMIGSGIFIVSAGMTQQLYSGQWLLLMWLFTGFITIAAALSYGELSGMFPKAGGQYVYLKEAYHPMMGFLYGWSFFTVIQTGTIAAVAVAFSKFSGYFLPVFEMRPENIILQLGTFSLYPAQLLGIGTLILLTAFNTRGVETGKWIQGLFTGTKLVALFGLLILGFIFGFSGDTWNKNWQIGWEWQSFSNTGVLTGLAFSGLIGAMASALVGSIFSSDAWNSITFIAGDMISPEKNIGRALLLSTLIVTIIYVLMNVMYLGTLPLSDIALAPQERVGVAAANEIFGHTGTYIIAVLIMVSTFGCNNGLIFSGARVYQTMANDGLFFKQAAKVNTNGVPAWALWAQCIWASVLCLSGKYGDLLNYVVFTVMLFYILTIAGVIILRVKRPEIARTYKTPMYPFLPIIYIILASLFCVGLLIYQPDYTWPGLIIVMMGIPVYYLFQQRNARKQ